MKHVMIDIETLGDVSNSVIVSIGAVRFDLETGETGEEFYRTIDIQSCLDNGLKVTGGTIQWWMRNSKESRKAIIDGGYDLEVVLDHFVQFLQTGDVLWSNGLRFDVAILEDAYQAIRSTIPWDFRNERDVRTLVSFAPEIKSVVVNTWNKTLHNAIEDCKLQIKYCSAIYNKLKIA